MYEFPMMSSFLQKCFIQQIHSLSCVVKQKISSYLIHKIHYFFRFLFLGSLLSEILVFKCLPFNLLVKKNVTMYFFFKWLGFVVFHDTILIQFLKELHNWGHSWNWIRLVKCIHKQEWTTRTYQWAQNTNSYI